MEAQGDRMDPTAVLEVRDLKKHFPVRGGVFRRVVGQVHAVDGVSLWIAPTSHTVLSEDLMMNVFFSSKYSAKLLQVPLP